MLFSIDFQHVNPIFQAEASDANSQRSDDSDSFVTPPLSLSANDNDQYTQLEEEEDEDEKHEDPMELDENDEEWKTVVPEVGL